MDENVDFLRLHLSFLLQSFLPFCSYPLSLSFCLRFPPLCVLCFSMLRVNLRYRCSYAPACFGACACVSGGFVSGSSHPASPTVLPRKWYHVI